MNDIIRRKVQRGATQATEGPSGADGGWRLAFPRAARDGAGLLVEVQGITLTRRSLAEVLELPPDRALIALLDGPAGGLGMIALSPDVSAALVEMQTIGRVLPQAPIPRRATRTDAAMVAGVIDRALSELESQLSDEADLVWAGGFRYASFLEDPRPLGLLLDEQAYRVLAAEVVLGGVGRGGQVLLVLPAEGRGRMPRPAAPEASGQAEGPAFAAALGAAVLAADCQLEAVLARLTLSLREVMALRPGQTLVLTTAGLERLCVEGMDGRPLARARLGQHRGMRALRLTDAEARPAVGDGIVLSSVVAGAAAPGADQAPGLMAAG